MGARTALAVNAFMLVVAILPLVVIGDTGFFGFFF